MSNISFVNFDKYKSLVEAMATLSRLFSETEKPYIPYRFVENLFVHSATSNAVDLSRKDNSFDCYVPFEEGNAGVGIKTFVTSTTSYKDEKVAEFTKYAHNHNLNSLDDEELAKKVAHLRNSRVQSDAREYGIDIEKSIYHCLIRDDGCFYVHEEPYPLIDETKIKVLSSKGLLTFTDGINTYKYSTSKNVLLKRFHLGCHHNSESIQTHSSPNPFDLLLQLNEVAYGSEQTSSQVADQAVGQGMAQFLINNLVAKKKQDLRPFVILPLYSTRDGKVPEKSGINQWNAGGRARVFGEAYIPVPKEIHKNRAGFFPLEGSEKEYRFTLSLPNGESVNAKICQEGFKALMSDPNKALMMWLYDVIDGSVVEAERRFNRLDPTRNKPYTSQDLDRVGKDSVVIFKDSPTEFSMQFMPQGSYEKFKELGMKQMPFSQFLSELSDDED